MFNPKFIIEPAMAGRRVGVNSGIGIT